MKKPKILVLDIETKPLKATIWATGDQHVSLEQIKEDWSILAWSAKWYGEPASSIIYRDLRGSKDMTKDKKILKELWNLMNEADYLLTQNGNAFDIKKINARFALNGFGPPSPYKKVDTVLIARKHFGFTSNKLAYLTDKFCTKYKKLTHKKFPGLTLWDECMDNNKEAWDEMELYNKHDVLALDELYSHLQPWDNSVNYDLYNNELTMTCGCGKQTLQKRGYNYSNTGKFQRYQCTSCGAWTSGKTNLLIKEKKQSLRK